MGHASKDISKKVKSKTKPSSAAKKSESKAQPKGAENLHPLASTTECSEILTEAGDIRWGKMYELYQHRGCDGSPFDFLGSDKFVFDEFDLKKFLSEPVSCLGRLYKPIVLHFLSILCDLAFIYPYLNEKKEYGDFLTEISAFSEEVSGKKKGERNHPFWSTDNQFSGVVVCYMSCIHGLKISDPSDAEEVDYLLLDYAGANNAIGRLNIGVRINPEFFAMVRKAKKFDGGRKKGTYGTVKSEILRELKSNPKIAPAALFRKFLNKTNGPLKGGHTYEGEVLLYDVGSSITLPIFRSRFSEVKADIKNNKIPT